MQSIISYSGNRIVNPALALIVLASLLTGRHVSAGVSQEGSTLIVDGTRANDSVFIIGVDGHAGVVTVKFNNEPMVAHFGLTDIAVDLKGGNNGLALLQVHLAGDVSIAAADGDNYIVLGHWKYLTSLIWGGLSVAAGHGDNQVLMNETWVVGNTEINLGDGVNDVALGRADSPSDLGAVIFGDLTIETGTNDDLVEVVKSWVGGQTLIDTFNGADTIILGTHYATGSDIAGNVFNDLAVAAGAGSDGVGLTDNVVNGDTSIQMQGDDDELLLGAGVGFPPNDFHGDFTAHGGSGQDTLDNDPGNFYADPTPQFLNFELP